MKVKGLLPIALLAFLSLTGCQKKPVQPSESQPEQSESQSESSETIEYGVTIANKQALAAEWYKGVNRELDLTLTPEANALVEIRAGNLTITSSDPEVVSVSGLGLAALKGGSATITVAYHDATDSVALTILEASAITRYGTTHAGTLEDPLTNEDALIVAKHTNYDKEPYYVKGTIRTFYHAPGERTDGFVSWFLEPAQEGGEKFEVYKCLKEDGSFLTDDDIWKGGVAVAKGSFTVYSGQYETTSATFVSCEGTKPAARQVIDSTVADALAVAKALEDGDSTWDYYNMTGYVVKMSGNNYFIADRANASTTDNKTLFEIYTPETDPEKAPSYVSKLKYHAKVTVKAVLKNYHNQVENLLPLTDDDIEVLEQGSDWVEHAEPEVAERTLAAFIAGENVKTVAYKVTAQIKSWKTDAADKYGNMTITDGTNDLVMYGVTATASALAWDKYGATYVFTNPQDFLTNDVTKDLAIGATITLKMIRADYTDKNGVTTKQGSGVITAVGEGGGGEEQGLSLTLTAESLLGYDGSANVGYATDYATRAVDGVSFTYQQIGAYKSGFAGMQFRNKLSDSNNGTKSNLNNTTALPGAIESIDFTWHSSKEIKTNNNVLKITFGKDNTFANNTEVKMLNTTQDVKSMTVTPTGKDFTFVKIEIDDAFTYTCYWDNIKLNLAEAEEQQEVLPVGNFSGHATTAAGNIFTMIALGSEAAFVEVAIPNSPVKLTTTYTYAAATNTVTITDSSLGTITAVYNETDNALEQVTLADNPVAAAITDNGQIVLSGAKYFFNCDGTTAELKNVFNRRVQSNGWVISDENNALLEAADGIAGQGVKIGGNTSYAVSLVLKNQMAADVEATSNIGFWVYNPTTSNVTLRQWMFIGADLNNGKEQGNVTAVAGQWTYVRMGFASGNDPISYQVRNFSLADFTKSGATLTFDNIALF